MIRSLLCAEITCMFISPFARHSVRLIINNKDVGVGKYVWIHGL
ncbi:hypothetical protein C900_03925 [Fulvivirga imtechensis AK7]|uniref:Uncharacterized protein n=1 Tax=Fulvivirga imtechensis AK7 TaxID=1237149 RepID=L8JN56_9BACT|nr:hypothetical protein C900_03925 [Fulvivirga imtechensis AK7]